MVDREEVTDGILRKEQDNLIAPNVKSNDPKAQISFLLNPTNSSGAAADLDIIDYLNANFNTMESLEGVDTVIDELNNQIGDIDLQLKEVIRD